MTSIEHKEYSKEDEFDESEKLGESVDQASTMHAAHGVAEAAQRLDWDTPNNPNNPRNFSNARKWMIAGAALLGTLVIPLNGTSVTAATSEIDAAFNISEHPFPNSYWLVTSWTLGAAVFLVAGMSLMEDLGVRNCFLGFYAFFILMIVPQALARSFATLVVTRFLSGGCVSLLANAASSIIPDLWATEKERSLPISSWILTYMLGNTLGPPIFAGIVRYSGDWRWIFYSQLIIYGSLFPFFWICIKETRCSVIQRRLDKQSQRAGDKTDNQLSRGSELISRLAKAAVRPMYLQFTEPLLMGQSIWSGFSFGTVFLFTQSVEHIYSPYGWSSWAISYVQVAVAVGEIVGWALSLYGTQLYLRSASRNTESPGCPIPEARLYVSVFGTFIGITGGMFVYAWTADVHWILPTIGLGMVGMGIQVVVSAVADYTEDAYAASDYAASAISAIAVAENLFAGCLPLATSKMYTTLGNSWASTLLGCIALLISFAPVLFIWKGRWFRERSPFMLSAGEICEARQASDAQQVSDARARSVN